MLKLALCVMCVFVCMCKCVSVCESIAASRYELAPSRQEERVVRWKQVKLLTQREGRFTFPNYYHCALAWRI